MRTNIITHAFNRLEYTVDNVVSTNTLNPENNYTHIIIDQGSTDGSREWLHSLEVEDFYPIKVKYNQTNTGDAGGVKDGMGMLDPDCEFVLQQNNDLIPETEDYIAKLEGIMDADPKIGAIMLKRNGVGTVLEMLGEPEVINDIRLYTTQRPVAFYFRRSLLDQLNYYKTGVNIGWVFEVASLIKRAGYKVYKTPDITLMHKHGTWKVAPNGRQAERYSKYFASRRKDLLGHTNFKDINYKNTHATLGRKL